MTHRTAAVLAAAAALSAPAAAFAPTALPLSQGHGRALRQAAAAPRMGLFDGLLGGGKDSKAVVFKEWTQQDVVDGPKGAGLAGNVDVVFKIGEDVKTTRAFAGAPLSEVAAQVDLEPGAPQPGRPCRLAPVLPRPAPPRPGLLGSAAARLLAPAGGHAHVRARGWLQPGRMRIRAPAPTCVFRAWCCSRRAVVTSRAGQADAFIPYKCKKGECGTCDVLVDGKWVHACQTRIPSVDSFQVNIRPARIPPTCPPFSIFPALFPVAPSRATKFWCTARIRTGQQGRLGVICACAHPRAAASITGSPR